jgi:WD40 repeat protein
MGGGRGARSVKDCIWLLSAVVSMGGCRLLEPTVVTPDGGAAATTGVAAPDATSSGSASDPGTQARTSQARCPDVQPAPVPASLRMAPVPASPAAAGRVPTTLPFSCNPLPRTFVFPTPEPAMAGRFTRCASLSLAGTDHVALSPDGRLAALLNGDGIARVVDVASQQVIAAFAPARARVTRVAFSPSGDAALTVAGGAHEVTLWQAGSWTPIWTVTVPGHTYGYQDGSAGAIAFSPDGKSVAVSPGTGLYLLDVATGGLHASYASAALMDVAYAWGGRRIVVADAILTGHCVYRPVGGSVVVLDPQSLEKLVTVASWAGYADDLITPGFWASPTDDLVFVPAHMLDPDPSRKAFRISDGSPLPATAITGMLALMPDGATLLTSADGELRLERLDGGAIVARAPVPQVSFTTPFAVSRDGSTVAIGGAGPDILHVWNTSVGYLQGVCALDGGPTPGDLSLAGGGHFAAQVAGTYVQIVRPEDGAVVSTLHGSGDVVGLPSLSHDGRYIAGVFGDMTSSKLQVIDTHYNGTAADLSKYVSGPLLWSGFQFSPDERTFAAAWQRTIFDAATTIIEIDLRSGAATQWTVPPFNWLMGFSRGCPLLWNQLTGLWRSCPACDEVPFGPSAHAPAVSVDARFEVLPDPAPALSATLWSLDPIAHPLRAFSAPVDPDGLVVQDAPWAVTPDASRVLMGASNGGIPCYHGPSFEGELLDGETGAVLDRLPPDAASHDDALTRISFGSEVWCRAR